MEPSSQLEKRQHKKKEVFYLSHKRKKNRFPIGLIQDGDQDQETIYLCDDGDGEFNKLFLDESESPKIRLLFDLRPGHEPCFWVGGARNSGKTTFCRNLIEHFHQVCPKKDVFLVSDVERDPILDELKYVMRIPMNEKLMNVDVKETLPDCFIVFDDVLNVENKDLKDKIMAMMKTILNNGRHHGIIFCATSHLLNPDEKSLGRKAMADISYVTFFPGAGIDHQITYFLKHYMGFKQDLIDSVLKLNTRWVTVQTFKPRMLIWEKGIYRL